MQAMQYDTSGRVWKKWRPYSVSDPTHTFRTDVASEAESYYGNIYGGSGTDRAFVETIYASDPRGRISQVFAPGEEVRSTSVAYGSDRPAYDGGEFA